MPISHKSEYSYSFQTFVDEFRSIPMVFSSLKINDGNDTRTPTEFIRIRICDFMYKLVIVLERRVLRSMQNMIEDFLKDEFFMIKPGRELGIKLVQYLKKRLKDKIFESLVIDFLEDEEMRQIRLKAKKKNYSYLEGESDDESSDVSEIDEDIDALSANNKISLKVEAKIDKLEKHLNQNPTKDDKIRLLTTYMVKEDNFMVAITLITRPNDFESRSVWRLRRDIGNY